MNDCREVIDKLRLDDWKDLTKDGIPLTVFPNRAIEMIRLVELGLWAEKEGIKTIRWLVDQYDKGFTTQFALELLNQALATLPKESDV